MSVYTPYFAGPPAPRRDHKRRVPAFTDSRQAAIADALPQEVRERIRADASEFAAEQLRRFEAARSRKGRRRAGPVKTRTAPAKGGPQGIPQDALDIAKDPRYIPSRDSGEAIVPVPGDTSNDLRRSTAERLKDREPSRAPTDTGSRGEYDPAEKPTPLQESRASQRAFHRSDGRRTRPSAVQRKS